MKTLRQVHLYLGCVFAPLIIYFSLSGVWQVFRWNDVPKGEVAPVRSFLHELSRPHKDAVLPGAAPKSEGSEAFEWAAAAMGIGMIATAGIGVALALRFGRKPRVVIFCLVAGAVLPVLFLFLR